MNNTSIIDTKYFSWAFEVLKEYGKNDLTEIFQIIDLDENIVQKTRKKLYPVIERLKLVDLLFTPDTYGDYFEAGFSNENSLRIYLLATCFDFLGQNESHETFEKWISRKKLNNKTAFRNEKISKLINCNDGTIDIEFLRSSAESLYRFYNEQHGVNESFKKYFTSIIDEDMRKKMLDWMWIIDNPFAEHPIKTPAMEFILPRPKKWEEKNENEKINKLVNALTEMCRNSFTHGLQKQYDEQEKNRLDKKSSMVYKHLKHELPYRVVYDIREFGGYINAPEVLTKDCVKYRFVDDELLVMPLEPGRDIQGDIDFFLFESEKRSGCDLGACYITKKDRKEVLCIKDNSLIMALREIAWNGVYNTARILSSCISR